VTGWRAALRIARRQARRARGRSALVVAMIALPVAALAFVAVAQDTFKLTPDEQADRLMGKAQAVMTWPDDQPVHQHATELLWGPADLSGPGGGPIQVSGKGSSTASSSVQRLLALLPPGSRAIGEQLGALAVRTATGTGTLATRTLDLADPLARGILRPLSGRAPASASEVALTPAASRRLGAGLGGTVRSADGSGSYRVVGIVEDPTDLESSTIVLRIAPPPDPRQDPRVTERWLVATPNPLTWTQVKQLNTHGVVAVSRYVLAHPPSAAERYPEFSGSSGTSLGVPALVGGLALLEVVLLAGPAFAVGARRRRRELALVAAAGGTPAHLRRIVLADGVVLGVLAAATGVGLGIVFAALGRPLIERHIAHVRSGGFQVFPLALAALAGLAVVTGVLAALVPAWIASRQDVVTALAGRRGITRSRRRWVALGAVLAAVGACVAATGALRVEAALILAGLVVVELGLVLCTPAVVGLVARLGRFLPLAPRIALRDTSRNRTAAAPAISAVMAAVIGSLAVGVVLSSEAQRTRDDHRSWSRPGGVVLDGTGKEGEQHAVSPQAVAALRRTMPVRQVHLFGRPSCGPGQCFVTPQVPASRACPYSLNVLRRDPTPAEQRVARHDSRCEGVGGLYTYFAHLAFADNFTLVVDHDAVGAVTGLAAGDAGRAAAALHAGKVVVDHPRYLDGGQVTLTITSSDLLDKTKEKTRSAKVPGYALPSRPRAPITLMTWQTARSLGLDPVPSIALAATSRMPTVVEQDRLQSALGLQASVYVERGPKPASNTQSLLVLSIVAGLITLGAAAIATGLAAADGRAELGTLAAVGASPRLRRGLSLSQSGVIAGLGSLLGAVAGLGGSIAVLIALNRGYADLWPAPTPYRIAVPWLNVAVAVLVVPAVAMLGAGLFTRSRLPIERRL
jgi:putative ABC transport system permease protein